MSLTPVEIRHVDLGRRPLGYDRTADDELLADVAASFEHVWRERADLRDELEELESELARQKELEQALRNTLLSAERMADDMRTQARREADVIVAEARSAARDIVSGAETREGADPHRDPPPAGGRDRRPGRLSRLPARCARPPRERHRGTPGRPSGCLSSAAEHLVILSQVARGMAHA